MLASRFRTSPSTAFQRMASCWRVRTDSTGSPSAEETFPETPMTSSEACTIGSELVGEGIAVPALREDLNNSVILSRRSAAKDLRMRCRWLVLRNLRYFAVYAAQDDGC